MKQKKAYKVYPLMFCFLFLLFNFLFLNLRNTAGQAMSNQDFTIRTENIDQTPETLPAQKDDSIREGVNFKVNSGFTNLNQKVPFTIGLSARLVDFGKLSPTNPIIRTAVLSLEGLPLHGYSVLAFENHSLEKNDISIPDTTCDNGTCTQENADEWINTLTYGFGFRCDNLKGMGCDISFISANYYKQYPNISNSHIPLPVIKGIGSKDIEAKLSHKVNISPNMPDNVYSNQITFIAIPNF